MDINVTKNKDVNKNAKSLVIGSLYTENSDKKRYSAIMTDLDNKYLIGDNSYPRGM